MHRLRVPMGPVLLTHGPAALVALEQVRKTMELLGRGDMVGR